MLSLFILYFFFYIMFKYLTSDGYINLNQLCKAGEKEFKTWKENKKSKAFIKELSRDAGIPADELIKYKSGANSERANWGLPQVAINIAQWVSPVFDVQVSKWVFELMVTGKVTLGEEKSAQELEKMYQDQIETLTNQFRLKEEELEQDLELYAIISLNINSLYSNDNKTRLI
jgi:hypothetical protein